MLTARRTQMASTASAPKPRLLHARNEGVRLAGSARGMTRAAMSAAAAARMSGENTINHGRDVAPVELLTCSHMNVSMQSAESIETLQQRAQAAWAPAVSYIAAHLTGTTTAAVA